MKRREEDPLLGDYAEEDEAYLEESNSREHSKKMLWACCPCDMLPAMVLLLICLLTFGSYWVYDTPGAIQTQLTEWWGGESHYTNLMNLTLYSVYSYPNIILCLIGGFLMDRWFGVRLGSLIFCGLIFVGEFIFVIGVQTRAYWLCVVGRFVFGLGGESLTVAQNAFTARWFDGPNLNLAFSVVLCFSRLGSASNFIGTPFIAKHFGVPGSVWFGLITCAMSFVACFFLALLDWYGRHRINEVKSEEKLSPLHIRRFPLPAWIIFIICVMFYTGILTFYTVASRILQNTGHKYSADTASYFLFIPNFVSIFVFPLCGWGLDRYGKALWMTFLASCMLICAHVAFLANALEWVNINPIPIFVWLGVAYAFGATAIWPMLAFIMPNYILGTAYGVMTAVQNAGMAIFPNIIGFLQDHYSDSSLQYTLPIMIFIVCATIAAGMSVLLLVLDPIYTQGRLNSSAKDRADQKDELNVGEDGEDDGFDTRSLPSLMVGTVFVRKTAPVLRKGYLSKLGIQPQYSRIGEDA